MLQLLPILVYEQAWQTRSHCLDAYATSLQCCDSIAYYGAETHPSFYGWEQLQISLEHSGFSKLPTKCALTTHRSFSVHCFFLLPVATAFRLQCLRKGRHIKSYHAAGVILRNGPQINQCVTMLQRRWQERKWSRCHLVTPVIDSDHEIQIIKSSLCGCCRRPVL